MRPTRNCRPTLLNRLAAMLLLPFAAWSVLPATAAAGDICPAPEVVAAAMHACCPSHPSESAMSGSLSDMHAEGRHDAHDAAATPTFAAAESEGPTVSPENPEACACIPARDGPSRPAELPAATFELPAPRVPCFPGATSVLPPENPPFSRSNLSRCPDESRRMAAAPPLFLLHELLLI